MVDDAVNNDSEKKMSARKNKQANELACAIDTTNNQDKKEMKEVKKRVKSSKAINDEEEEGSDEDMTITKINKISDGTVAENTKDAVMEDFKALDCTTVLEDYIKEHNTDFDKPPQKQWHKKHNKVATQPKTCLQNHDVLTDFCEEAYARYFEEEKDKPVLVCKSVMIGCKWGYCLDHKEEKESKGRRCTT
eukprot:316421-Ditylum_brightwellii.AAC.1